MSTEDQRAAAGISVTISSQLIAAALAMLTIEGAIVAFIYGARETKTPFLWFLIGAAICFILSIYNGGLGMDSVRIKGHDGSWSKTEGQSNFNRQAILCIVGLVLFFLCAFCIGPPIKDETQAQIVSMNQRLAQVEQLLKVKTNQAPSVPSKSPEKKANAHKAKCAH